jgi:hypothetical protein
VNAAIEMVSRSASASYTGKRCAVVECYNRHDEVYLTTVYLLQQLGYEVEVFNTVRNRLKNSFVHTPGLAPQVHSFLRSAQVLDAVRRRRFDLVVMNSFESDEVLDCTAKLLLDTPVLAFVHNGSRVCDLPQYQSYLAHPRCRLMVLAPYVARHFAHLTTAGTMYPVFFFDEEVPALPRSEGRRRFCVQGYFDPARRDYGQLLDALRDLRREGRSDFEVHITGRSFAREFREFAREVRASGLEDHVSYTWKGIGYRSYYRLLNSMDYILPLISPESHPRYFTNKSTSSIAAAVGFNAIPVTHEELARHYGIEDVAFTYREHVLPAMRRALDIRPDELAVLRARMAATRQRLLEDSRRDLERAIELVRLPSDEPLRPPDLRPVEALAG